MIWKKSALTTLIAAALPLASAFMICGPDDQSTCINLAGDTVQLFPRSKKDDDLRKYFQVNLKVSGARAWAADENLMNEARSFSNCTEPQTNELLTYNRVIYTCYADLAGAAAQYELRSYKQEAKLMFGDTQVNVTKGDIKMYVTIQWPTEDDGGQFELYMDATWEVPTEFGEILDLNINNVPDSVNDMYTIYENAAGLVTAIDVNGVFHAYIDIPSDVQLCNTDTCAAAIWTDFKSNEAEMLDKKKLGSETAGATVDIPTHVHITSKWDGVRRIMKMDPVMSVKEGQLVSGDTDIKALFWGVLSAVIVVLGLCICLCCRYCSWCPWARRRKRRREREDHLELTQAAVP